MTLHADKTALSRPFYTTGGTLQRDAPSYVTRRADTVLYESLLRSEFCYVLNTRQMGKSSLMVRTATRLREAGVTIAVLDLTAIGQNLTPEQWYDGLLALLAEQLRLEDELEDFWLRNPERGPLQRFFAALRHVVLPTLNDQRPTTNDEGESESESESENHGGHGEHGEKQINHGGHGGTRRDSRERPPTTDHRSLEHLSTLQPEPLVVRRSSLVIFVDEIDAIRSLPFSTDEFFAAIREIYNRRAEEPELNRLTFCLLGVATPSNLIKDTRTTPFNIGTRIELRDFTPEETTPLAQGLNHGKQGGHGEKLLERIHYWTGGHPYLTQRLCAAVSEHAGERQKAKGESDTHPSSLIPHPFLVDRLCQDLFLSSRAREQDDNLLFVRERILRSGEDLASLLDLYGKVLAGRRVPDDETSPLVSELLLSGIVRPENGLLKVRNRIYAQVFDRAWILAHIPDAELQRQRAAYRRGVLRTATVSAVLFAIFCLLLINTIQATGRATTGAILARAAEARAVTEAERANKNRQAALASAELARKNERTAHDANERAQSLAQQRTAALNETVRQRNRANLSAAAARQAAEQADLARRRAASEANFARMAAHREKTERARAENLTRVAKNETVKSRRHLYLSQMTLALQAYDAGNSGRAREILELQRPERGQTDLRGFEWRMLWHLCQSPEIAAHRLHDDIISWATLSPDGKTLATSSFDKTVKLWEFPSMKPLATLQRHTAWALSVAFSPDGKRLVTTGADFRTYLWDIANRSVIRSLSTRDGNAVVSSAFSPDGNRIVLGTSQGYVGFWNLTLSEKSYQSTLNHSSTVYSVAFSPDGKTVVSAGADKTVRLWNPQNREELAVLKGHENEVWRVAFSPDGKTLATGSRDQTIKLWDFATRREKFSLKGHTDTVAGLAFSPDGKTLATGSFDHTVKLWNLSTLQERATLVGHTSQAGCVLFTADGTTLLSASADKTVRLWNAAGSRGLDTLQTPNMKGQSLAFSPDSALMAVSEASIVRLLDTRTWQEVGRLKGHRYGIYQAAFSPDGKTIATGDSEGFIKFWDAATRREIASTKVSSSGFIAYSPDSKKLAIAHQQPTVALWDATTQKIAWTLGKHKEPADFVLFSRDGKLLFTAGRDQEIQVWRLSDWQQVGTLTGHTGYILSLAQSPDGKTLASAGLDNIIRLWDIATLKQVGSLRGHKSLVMSVAFSRDGKTLASGSDDSTVKLWNLATQQEIATLRGHTNKVWRVAFSPDGNTLATASDDETVRLYRASSFAETDRKAGVSRK